jgi:hypothetical protein
MSSIHRHGRGAARRRCVGHAGDGVARPGGCAMGEDTAPRCSLFSADSAGTETSPVPSSCWPSDWLACCAAHHTAGGSPPVCDYRPAHAGVRGTFHVSVVTTGMFYGDSRPLLAVVAAVVGVAARIALAGHSHAPPLPSCRLTRKRASGHGVYAAGGAVTSVLTHPGWLILECALMPPSDRLTVTSADTDASLDEDTAGRAAQRLAETLALHVRLTDSPLSTASSTSNPATVRSTAPPRSPVSSGTPRIDHSMGRMNVAVVVKLLDLAYRGEGGRG